MLGSEAPTPRSRWSEPPSSAILIRFLENKQISLKLGGSWWPVGGRLVAGWSSSGRESRHPRFESFHPKSFNFWIPLKFMEKNKNRWPSMSQQGSLVPLDELTTVPLAQTLN